MRSVCENADQALCLLESRRENITKDLLNGDNENANYWSASKSIVRYLSSVVDFLHMVLRLSRVVLETKDNNDIK